MPETEPPAPIPSTPPQTQPPMGEPYGVEIDIRGGAGTYGLQGVNPQDITNPACVLPRLVDSILSMVMIIAILLLLLYLLWGALDWITSGGDKGKTEKARDKMTGASIGILVLSSVVVIFMIIQRFLGITVLSFNGSCGTGGTTPPPTSAPPTAPVDCSTANPADGCQHPSGRCILQAGMCVPCVLNPQGECDGSG